MSTLSAEKPQRSPKSLIPILEWLPKYDKTWIRWDVIAALTVWALLVPEAMAYAGIAGMPPQTGLYTAPLALIGYAIFGTSRHLNVGPSSTVAILSFAIIGGMAVAGGPEFIALTTGLALMTGVLLILAGLFKLGVLADFLSKPVLGGFIIGLAITIAFGQVGKLLGYDVEADGFFREVLKFVLDIHRVHIPTLIVGVTSLAALFLMHKYIPKIPAAITVLILAIIASAALKLHDNYGVHIDSLREKGIEVWFSGVLHQVYETLEQGGIVDKIGRDHFYVSLEDAVEAYLQGTTETTEPQNA